MVKDGHWITSQHWTQQTGYLPIVPVYFRCCPLAATFAFPVFCFAHCVHYFCRPVLCSPNLAHCPLPSPVAGTKEWKAAMPPAYTQHQEGSWTRLAPPAAASASSQLTIRFLLGRGVIFRTPGAPITEIKCSQSRIQLPVINT